MVKESAVEGFNPNCNLCHSSSTKFPHFTGLGVSSELPSYPVAETRNFRVLPDILPVNPDGRHFLITPRNHCYNLAGLVAHADELEKLICELGFRFGSMVFFEHGGLQQGNNHQSISHAHVHALGGLEGVDVIGWMSYMLTGGLSPEDVYPHTIVPAPNYGFLGNLSGVFNGLPYLYLQQGGWGIIAHDPNGQFRSQIIQRAMHLFFSGEVLDWKQIPDNEQFAKESVRRIMNLVEFCEYGSYYPHRF